MLLVFIKDGRFRLVDTNVNVPFFGLIVYVFTIPTPGGNLGIAKDTG
jgi:hypothetical protein